MKNGCLECGEELFGRIDKKFCSSQCRSSYYNKQNSSENSQVRNVNNILKKNRRILEDFSSDNKLKAQRERLLEKGFNFTYYTNTYTTKDNRVYYYCYDFGYLEFEEGWYAIVKKLDWV